MGTTTAVCPNDNCRRHLMGLSSSQSYMEFLCEACDTELEWL
jgi:hypothetical protein